MLMVCLSSVKLSQQTVVQCTESAPFPDGEDAGCPSLDVSPLGRCVGSPALLFCSAIYLAVISFAHTVCNVYVALFCGLTIL